MDAQLVHVLKQVQLACTISLLQACVRLCRWSAFLSVSNGDTMRKIAKLPSCSTWQFLNHFTEDLWRCSFTTSSGICQMYVPCILYAWRAHDKWECCVVQTGCSLECALHAIGWTATVCNVHTPVTLNQFVAHLSLMHSSFLSNLPIILIDYARTTFLSSLCNSSIYVHICSSVYHFMPLPLFFEDKDIKFVALYLLHHMHCSTSHVSVAFHIPLIPSMAGIGIEDKIPNTKSLCCCS